MALFNKKGTQAFIAANTQQKRLVLAFRGTEPTSIKDIQSDIDARMRVSPVAKSKLHKGFSEAYEVIGEDIQLFLQNDQYHDYQLYITGHSLGGALATIEAKRLTHRGGIAACYTFGSPKVGNRDWVSDMKTPLYRIVNAADCVPLMPLGDTVITVLSYLIKKLKVLKFVETFLDQYKGYIHCGDIRFLTFCKPGDYSDAKLLTNTTFFQRLKGFILKGVGMAPLADHSITTYRKKLAIIAVNRNSP